MAQTVGFAILGAFILSLTYVPMMSALCLSKRTSHKRSISDRMMDFFQRIYKPLINTAIHHRLMVVIVAVVLLVGSLFVFSGLGGEFIPQLDEGDFAVETRVLTGSSIDQIIDASTKAQKIVLEKFPEVKQVVNKVGSGEIPTDPMPIEASDMMVILKDKSEWTSAKTREELAEKMQKELSVIPGVTFGFQQPIQMRFNELITGAKQDVVIKIYGEDLDVLTDEAAKLGKLIKPVKGVQDLYIEEVTGLPQIQIEFNRDKIAQYGLNIEDVNRVIKTAFAGETTGLVYEGEKRFEMVVRLDKENRTDLSDVSNLFIPTPTGQQIPLQEVATVEFKNGPNQIQRDDTKRRITIGFNVRGRDVESIVNEIQQSVAAKLKLPAGYYVTYGGQFENLVAARNRLAIAVPIALLLILVLLYFTFSSIRETLLIFTAIPLSAIGGILALWVRDMPFSISAGIGFIALFGVAVLNGIVLIGEFNRLKREGVADIYERVLQGTQIRLRPVLMTAAVASLGFLPMALSNSAGAEVQKPLATVVIGGLLSATLLTLVVLPSLYIIFEKKKTSRMQIPITTVLLFLLAGSLLFPTVTKAQTTRRLNQEQAIAEAVKNNNRIKAASYEVDLQTSLQKATTNLPKTELLYSQGQINSNSRDNSIGITQKIEYPSVYKYQSQLAAAQVTASRQQLNLTEYELRRDIKFAFNEWVYQLTRQQLLLRQDSLFGNLAKASTLRYKTGESNQLEKVTSEAQSLEVKNRLAQVTADIAIAKQRLQTLINTKDDIALADTLFTKKELNLTGDSNAIVGNPYLAYLQQQIIVNKADTKLQQSKRLPDLIVGYYNQSFRGIQNFNGVTEKYTGSDRFHVFQAGIAIALLPGGYKGKIAAAKINEQVANANLQYQQTNLLGQLQELVQQYNKYKSSLEYYEQTALPQAELIIQNAQKGFKSGDIAYIQYLQSLSLALKTRADYIDNLYWYNQTIIEIETLTGKK